MRTGFRLTLAARSGACCDLPHCWTHDSARAGHMLYVACTRAMHRLTLTCTGEPGAFLRVGIDGGVLDVVSRDPADRDG